MNWSRLGALGALVGMAGCGNGEDFGVEGPAARALTTAETLKIGVLIDDGSPARDNFIAAADLAEGQLNQGLDSAGSDHRFEVVVKTYAGPSQAQNAAIDLVNTDGVLGVVGDSDSATAETNELNHEFIPRIARKVPVTCFDCSSPRFNHEDIELGFADPEGWLFRTYFSAEFETPIQARLVLNRPRKGDFNRDGHLKIVVYYDHAHFFAAIALQGILDQLHTGSHSVELVLDSGPGAAPLQMAEILDDGPDGRFPDAVYLALPPDLALEALTAYTARVGFPKPPIQANDGLRRDFRLPALLAAGGAVLEGSSVLRVDNTASGPMFRSAFEDATDQQPEVGAAYLYDAIVVQAGAIGWAVHFESLDPAVIQGNFPNVNDPTGRKIRPRPSEYRQAIQRINEDKPINYEGGGSAVDLDGAGENFPDLVHWRIRNGQFDEMEKYRCDPERPLCVRR